MHACARCMHILGKDKKKFPLRQNNCVGETENDPLRDINTIFARRGFSPVGT